MTEHNGTDAIRCIAAAGLTLLGCTIHDASGAPAGWVESGDSASPTATKTFSGNKMQLQVSPWMPRKGSLKSWLANNAKKSPKGYRFYKSKLKIDESLPKGSYQVLRQVRGKDGMTALSLLSVCPGRNNTMRTIDSIGEKSVFVHRPAVNDLVKALTYYCSTGSQSPRTTTAANQQATGKISTAPISAPRLPVGFAGFRGVIYYGMQAGGMFGPTSMTIALFDDHTYTDDIATVFREGASVSKRKNPKDWGQWRKRGGKLELKDHNDKEFDKTRGDWVAVPGSKNQKLNGCFGRLVSSDGLGVGSAMVGRASAWCFSPNGRFTHDATGFGSVSGAGVSGATSSSSPTVRGRYRIDGYAMHLVYDDGSDVQAGFAFLNDDRTHIAVNGKRFMGNK